MMWPCVNSNDHLSSLSLSSPQTHVKTAASASMSRLRPTTWLCPAVCRILVSSFYATAWSRSCGNKTSSMRSRGIVGATRCWGEHELPCTLFFFFFLERATMRGTLGAFIQSCVILLVRADQWRLKDSANCELNRKVSHSEARIKEWLHCVIF